MSAVLGAGCMTAPTMRQTARTMDPGELRLSAGASLPISEQFVGALADTVDGATGAARDARDSGRPLTEEEQRELEESAMALLLFAVLPVFEIDARYGIADDLDAGLRYGGSSLRVDGKYRLVASEAGDLALALGYTYHFGLAKNIGESLFDLFEFELVLEHDRHDFDVAVMYSPAEDSDRIVTPYASGRYLLSLNTFELRVDSSLTVTDPLERDVKVSEAMHVLAATGGLRIGPPKIHLMIELTVAYAILTPEIGDRTLDLSGVIFIPMIGLGFETG
jgi:hypothetical protein